MEAMIRKHVT